MSKVVVFGKIPPIEGGVSARTLDFIRALSESSNSVTVVTNSRDVPSSYGIGLLPEDEVYLNNKLASVDIIDIGGRQVPFHIPMSQGYETRLIGAGWKACSEADLIIGWYLQPYGVCAAISAKLLNKPCVLMHAGSDIGRIALAPEFGAAYKAVFEQAKIISTSKRSRNLLKASFAESQIIEAAQGYSLPSYFNAKRRTKAVSESVLKRRAQRNLTLWGLSKADTLSLTAAWERNAVETSFHMGVYGKIGEKKGHFDLLSAIEVLGRRGINIRLTIITGGAERAIQRLTKTVLNSATLSERVRIVPFVPPWEIPHFIDLCDAIAFLERDFPIAIHGPQVPMEVMRRGTPLICSHEIIKKQFFRDSLKAWTNYIPAGDPRQIDALASTIERATKLPNLKDVGVNGRGLMKVLRGGAKPRDNFLATVRQIHGFL
jgi:glycosyltransferase involved in cell wall biosynthesis